MTKEAQLSISFEDEQPLMIVCKAGKTIAVTLDIPLAGLLLPFSIRACDVMHIVGHEDLRKAREAGTLNVIPLEWPIRVKMRIALDTLKEGTHWLLLSMEAEKRNEMPARSFKGTEEGLQEVVAWLKSVELQNLREIILASEPPLSEMSTTREIRHLRLPETDEQVNERVIFAFSEAELVLHVEDFLTAFFLQGLTAPTAVFWPALLSHPINIHYGVDELRVTEHDALFLPVRPLLHLQQRVKDWVSGRELHSSPGMCMPRTGRTWEKHLICKVHTMVKNAPSSTIAGGDLFVVSNAYDYYHYRVDGFKDDGWGCAYRSLQTILSWFQYEGLMDRPIPDLPAIQRILFVNDPEKRNRGDFVGSREWIGSFEIMIVLQHYVRGIECIIKRIESGSELESDPTVQELLVNHFRRRRACPVMIGGSSYAHTILGISRNLDTMEVRYLVADPHYSSSKTEIKTVINKGYVGWKKVGSFFEANSWYNLCIPQVASYDPR